MGILLGGQGISCGENFDVPNSGTRRALETADQEWGLRWCSIHSLHMRVESPETTSTMCVRTARAACTPGLEAFRAYQSHGWPM